MDEDLVLRAHWGNLEGTHWAVLVRLSTDEDDDGRPADQRGPMTGRDIKSTKEQERDGRRFITKRGGRCVYVYAEPDTSAWRKKRVRLPDGRVVYRVVRPVFEGALEDLKSGQAPNGERLDGLIVYDIDRLTRDNRHLEDAIDVVERFRRPIIDINGSLDLLTENGRATARVVVAMSNKQSADTSRRVRRHHRALEREGIPTGGARPFGWNADKRTLHPQESKYLREGIDRILGGAPVRAVTQQWNEKGITTPRGNSWNTTKLKTLLRNPRLCGYRSRKVRIPNPTTGSENERWEVVYDDEGNSVIGQWDRLVSPEKWQALLEVIGDHMQPGTGHNTRRYLLTGTLRCDKNECGMPLRAAKAGRKENKPEGFFYYTCPDKGAGGCGGGTKIPGPEADKAITELVIAKYEAEAAAREATAAPKTWEGEEELKRVREDIADAKEARQLRILTKDRYFSLLQEYTAKERRLERDRNRWIKQQYSAQGKPVDLRAEWDDLTLAEQRAYVEQTLTAVLVSPAIGRRKPVHTRLTPLFRSGEDDA
ncbi:MULTISPECIES: recombinase family protein [Streptomyces]|uniref:Site-specific DNA recombinase n=1 Tax=Streptomyces aidingensis TaxID=910347 RepID=A0A1I1RMM7_9ACTN|nr:MULTISPECIES: recombinase family protein [Streptomyces]SFD33558.1 Site-specific DNA recombinase [Streptomyces aidingensis]